MPCKFLELWKMFKRFNLKACAWYCLCSKCEFLIDAWNCLYLQGLRVRSTWPRHEASHVSRVPVWYACATNRQHSTRYMWVSMATKRRFNIFLLPLPEKNFKVGWASDQRVKLCWFLYQIRSVFTVRKGWDMGWSRITSFVGERAKTPYVAKNPPPPHTPMDLQKNLIHVRVWPRVFWTFHM